MSKKEPIDPNVMLTSNINHHILLYTKHQIASMLNFIFYLVICIYLVIIPHTIFINPLYFIDTKKVTHNGTRLNKDIQRQIKSLKDVETQYNFVSQDLDECSMIVSTCTNECKDSLRDIRLMMKETLRKEKEKQKYENFPKWMHLLLLKLYYEVIIPYIFFVNLVIEWEHVSRTIKLVHFRRSLSVH